MAKVLQYPELRVNPFGDQICKVFSSSNDGDCTFEDFLDMMSVFSDAAPRSVKAEHAFRIFDFDGDDMLGITDLKHVIERLIGDQNNLSENDMKQLIQNILAEADLDDDHALSFPEFEQWVSDWVCFDLRFFFVISNNSIPCPFSASSTSLPIS